MVSACRALSCGTAPTMMTDGRDDDNTSRLQDKLQHPAVDVDWNGTGTTSLFARFPFLSTRWHALGSEPLKKEMQLFPPRSADLALWVSAGLRHMCTLCAARQQLHTSAPPPPPHMAASFTGFGGFTHSRTRCRGSTNKHTRAQTHPLEKPREGKMNKFHNV